MLRHEWLADVLGGRPHFGPNGLVWLERLSSALHAADAVNDAADLWIAMGAVNGFLVGALRREVADVRSSRRGHGRPDWQREHGPYLTRAFQSGDYPTLSGLVVSPDRPEAGTAFDRELEVVLEGLRVTTRRGAH